MADNQADQGRDVDPQEFVRAVLHISPEDAERVRERTPGIRERIAAIAEEAERTKDDPMPEGAVGVRANRPTSTRSEKKKQEGPSADYGDDDNAR